MTLNSFWFIIYFMLLLIVVFTVQLIGKFIGDKAAKKLQIIIFLYKSDWRFCVCIFAVSLITYFFGISLGKVKNKKILIGGIIVLLLPLIYFKYTNFFYSSFYSIIVKDFVLLNIILPVGISFYTFSALSYIIDVYRGDYEAEHNFINLALYIAFFPKLTAGPIVRGKEFFLQLRNYRGLKLNAFSHGVQIFVFGLFKKIVLADYLGVFVDDVFFAPDAYNTGTVILAVISYSMQIYFDFSGYSDMAIGISKIIGFDFLPNFNLPYMSKNISDFWKRWHISLSSWFQDYLYIPLGGNRRGEIKTYINLILVMLISGLWHGAGWTFVIWGILHGCFSCLNRVIKKSKINTKNFNAINILLTFFLVTLLWVVFRADTFSAAIKVWKGMFTIHSGISQPYTWSFFALFVLVVSSLIAYIYSKKKGFKEIQGIYPVLDLSHFWNLVIFFTFIGLTIIIGYFGDTAFIYGKF